MSGQFNKGNFEQNPSNLKKSVTTKVGIKTTTLRFAMKRF